VRAALPTPRVSTPQRGVSPDTPRHRKRCDFPALSVSVAAGPGSLSGMLDDGLDAGPCQLAKVGAHFTSVNRLAETIKAADSLAKVSGLSVGAISDMGLESKSMLGLADTIKAADLLAKVSGLSVGAISGMGGFTKALFGPHMSASVSSRLLGPNLSAALTSGQLGGHLTSQFLRAAAQPVVDNIDLAVVDDAELSNTFLTWLDEKAPTAAEAAHICDVLAFANALIAFAEYQLHVDPGPAAIEFQMVAALLFGLVALILRRGEHGH
jgi:hypothetical protein